MKYILIFTITLLIISCKAQNIVPLFDGPISVPAGSYYKDVDNDLNTFEGEWRWENGNSSWTIQFQKFVMVPSSGESLWDNLVGEYQYIENGVELINELPFTPNTDNLIGHNLWGGVISLVPNGAPPCDECTANSRYVELTIQDPTRPGRSGDIIFVHFIENGIEKIRLELYNSSYMGNYDHPGVPNELTIPEGTYTFIKQ